MTNTAKNASSNPAWRDLETPGQIADAIMRLFEHRGSSRYDEVVTQTEHAAQTAGHAMAAGADRAAIAAAFLHDIGHLLMGEDEGNDDVFKTDRHHEEVGARFLANWFGPDVTGPVRLHVPAKRYLCAIDPAYHAGLSAGSVRSLELQGGPMTTEETESFASDSNAASAVDLRRWDDLGKDPGAPAPSMESLRTLLIDELTTSAP